MREYVKGENRIAGFKKFDEMTGLLTNVKEPAESFSRKSPGIIPPASETRRPDFDKAVSVAPYNFGFAPQSGDGSDGGKAPPTHEQVLSELQRQTKALEDQNAEIKRANSDRKSDRRAAAAVTNGNER